MRYSHHSMVALRSVCIGKILLHGLGYRYEDITEGEPVHDVEKNKRAGKHYSRHTVLKNRMVRMMTMIVIITIHLWFLDFAYFHFKFCHSQRDIDDNFPFQCH